MLSWLRILTKGSLGIHLQCAVNHGKDRSSIGHLKFELGGLFGQLVRWLVGNRVVGQQCKMISVPEQCRVLYVGDRRQVTFFF